MWGFSGSYSGSKQKLTWRQVCEHQSLAGRAEKDGGEANQEEKGAVLDVPSGKQNHKYNKYGKSPFLMGKSTMNGRFLLQH